MQKILVAILAVAMLICPASVYAAAKKPVHRTGPLVDVPDQPGLPRVLILGDSISIGYTLPTRELLKGVANVHRPAANCESTEVGLKHLDRWLGDKKWDVIHFNFGLHDLKYVNAHNRVTEVAKGHQWVPVEQYKKNLRELVERLKKTHAKLIFATTTPVPTSIGRIADADKPYNAAALEVMKDEGVAVDDLNTAVRPHLAEYQLHHNVHYTGKGYRFLAEQVAQSIRTALGK